MRMLIVALHRTAKHKLNRAVDLFFNGPRLRYGLNFILGTGTTGSTKLAVLELIDDIKWLMLRVCVIELYSVFVVFELRRL